MAKKTQVITSWIGRKDAIAATGLTQNQFEQRVRMRIRESETRQARGRKEFLLAAVLRAFAEDHFEQRRPDAMDDDMTGPVTPNLERFRGARADIQEMDRDERKRLLVNRTLMEELITRGLLPIRRWVERLQQLHGPTVADDFNSVLNESTAAVELAFTELGDGSGSSDPRNDTGVGAAVLPGTAGHPTPNDD